MNRKAVLFISHLINDFTISSYRKLKTELTGYGYDVIWALQLNGGERPELPDRIRFFLFDLKGIRNLGYSMLKKNSVMGSVNCILLGFYNERPDYDCYWNIEYDTFFHGNWRSLLTCIDRYQYDLATCHIEKYDKERNGDWCWWKMENIDERSIVVYVKAFNPLFSISNRAASFLDEFMKSGCTGHYEVIMSTALYNNGYRLLDIGGTGDFTPTELRNKFYVQGKGINNGTMRYRPEFLKEEILALNVKDRLFHPLKSAY